MCKQLHSMMMFYCKANGLTCAGGGKHRWSVWAIGSDEPSAWLSGVTATSTSTTEASTASKTVLLSSLTSENSSVSSSNTDTDSTSTSTPTPSSA
ncbi:hypothetical protein BJX62DRAFT_195844 [Aspergillus germanicus]